MQPLLLSYNSYLQHLHGDKTYKLVVHIPSTCPNRDGTKGTRGCSFCSEKGTGFEASHNAEPIPIQLEKARERVIKRYKAKKFIAYFQNYTNTYMPVHVFMSYLEACINQDLVGIDIATRPDTLSDEYLEAIREFATRTGLVITFELGLQIANDSVLKAINRGHSVADYIACAKRIKAYGFKLCTHIILNLPGTNEADVLRTVRLMNQLEMDIVKLHSLYIAKGSLFAEDYLEGKIELGSVDEYVNRVILFMTHLNPSCAIARLVSRIPEEDALFSNWNLSWWKVYNMIMETMTLNCQYQGQLYGEVRHEEE